MKNCCLTGILLFSLAFSFANPVNISLLPSGNWRLATTWSLNRLPAHGDTILIPTGKTVILDNNQNLGSADLFIKLYGTLVISGGKLSLSANSSVTVYTGGIIIGSGSPAETIKIGSISKFDGSLPSITGPLIANNSTGSIPAGFNTFIEVPLPVKFIGFNVARQQDDVLIQWATSEEINNHYFRVQRSENGRDWTTIATLNADNKFSSVHTYSYTDQNTFQRLLYYRIQQVDLDGRSAFTSTRMTSREQDPGNIQISTVTANTVYIHFPAPLNSQVTILLETTAGQRLCHHTYNNPVGQILIPVTTPAKGIYIVTVRGRGLKYSKQVIL